RVLAPDVCSSLVLDAPLAIRSQTFGNSTGSPVKIALYQDNAAGTPQFLTTIVASTPDTGVYAWIPQSSGLTFGTIGLRVRVSLVSDAAVFDQSSEPSIVTTAGQNY